MTENTATATAEATETTTKAPTTTGDFILDTAAKVSAMGKVKAMHRVKALVESDGENTFELGGVLLLIKANNWYEGSENFNDFVEKRFGLQSRKSRYLISIYECLVNNQIPWSKVNHPDIGWTKLRELTRVLTAANVDEWVEKAKTASVVELIAMLKATSEGEGTPSTTTSSDTTTMRFKMHNDQVENVNTALAKAKAEANTEFDNVALDSIATAYLGGGTGATLAEQMQAIGPEATLEAFEKLWPDWTLAITPPGADA